MVGVANLVSQGSDGREDRAALFQHSEETQEKSWFPSECRVALWLRQHFELSAPTQWLPTGAPSASMSRDTLKPSLPLYKRTLH